MRTTVDLDEDILRTAKQIARAQEQTIGRVLSDLVRRGLAPPLAPLGTHSRIPTFERLPGARTVTSEIVKELLESED
jgi:hypothetical protein